MTGCDVKHIMLKKIQKWSLGKEGWVINKTSWKGG